jgi:hypothetical protein
MSESVTIQLPDDLAQLAHAVAAQTQRSVEEVLLDWLGRIAGQTPVNLLSDEQVLALADGQIGEREQKELNTLLSIQNRVDRDAAGRELMTGLLDFYVAGMTRKAQAQAVAVERGLRPAPDDNIEF